MGVTKYTNEFQGGDLFYKTLYVPYQTSSQRYDADDSNFVQFGESIALVRNYLIYIFNLPSNILVFINIPDMCLMYSRGGKIGASKCIVEPQLECPTIVYKSSDVFNCKLFF